jgi:hypothetical protein
MDENWNPRLIAIGLGVLLIAVYWPATPVVSAMALIALGATGATVPRMLGLSTAMLLLIVHLFVYSSLYLLMFGSVCHSARSGMPQAGLSLTLIDVALSLWPMSLAVRRVLAAIGQSRCGEDATPPPRR